MAIFDIDVHHGDGTEDIFKDNPNVMLCSTFQHPFYPHSGANSRSRNMINVPMPAKSNGEDFKKVFNTIFKPAVDAFKPDIVFISAGFDAHVNDPLADCALTTQDYSWISQFIKKIVKNHCQNRLISSLEGGYHLPSLSESALAHVEILNQ